MKRTMATVAAAAMAMVALSGCSREVSGSPVTDVGSAGTITTITGGGSAAERVPGLDRVSCQSSASAGGTECRLAQMPSASTASGALDLRPGDPVVYPRGAGASAVSVGAFVTDGSSNYALVGSTFVPPQVGAKVTTTDGKSVGTVAVIVRDSAPTASQPDSMWQLVAVKLDGAVRPNGGASSAAAPSNNLPLTVTGARSKNARVTAIADAQATGSGSAALGQGDLGAPADDSDGKLVAFVGISDKTLIPFTVRVQPALRQIAPTARLSS